MPQEYLETVLPAIGGPVVILAGPHKGKTATLQGIDTDKFSATVELQVWFYVSTYLGHSISALL